MSQNSNNKQLVSNDFILDPEPASIENLNIKNEPFHHNFKDDKRKPLNIGKTEDSPVHEKEESSGNEKDKVNETKKLKKNNKNKLLESNDKDLFDDPILDSLMNPEWILYIWVFDYYCLV